MVALGDDVAACSAVYYWPKENRKADGSGRLGILHVKCVVGDGRWLFLSSANLTVKGIMYTADCRFGGVLCGAACPVVFMSRADRTETRVRSLALALLLGEEPKVTSPSAPR